MPNNRQQVGIAHSIAGKVCLIGKTTAATLFGGIALVVGALAL